MSTIRLPLDSGFVLRRPRPTLLDAALRVGWRIATWPGRVLEARRVVGDLSRMSDRELSDIGLARQDLRDALGLPIDEDPSELFQQRALERFRRTP